MKEFIDKLIGRLEESKERYEDVAFFEMNTNGHTLDFEYSHGKEDGVSEAIEIVNELAEEYNNCSTDTSTDTSSGWIACSERLPQENEPVGTLCQIVNVMLKNGTVTSGWCNRYLEKWYVLDHHHDYPLPYEYKDVIAWQPLPAPYKEGVTDNE